MIDAASFWNIFIDKMPVKLSCTIPGCNHGDGVAMYKTPALEFDNALKMLDRHRAEVHGVKDERGGGAAVGRGESSILILIIIFQGKINVNIYIEPRDVDPVARMESFRALKLSRLESFRALKS